MDRADRKSKRERKSPRVPIKTYKWEEVRRSRKTGGYPWTHLYKQPFNEDADPFEFTMDGLRKAKSTSTMGEKSYLTISEMTESEREGSITPDVDKIDATLQIITEPDEHSMRNSATSVVIEECELSEREHKRPEFILDSAESSDDVSQYLDREEKAPPVHQLSDRKPADNENKTETSKRKRKLSAESSYSKTKTALIQKLKDTKNKLKVPKFSLKISKLKKPAQKRQKSSPTEVKKERKKSNGHPKPTKPVYIHIPLRPPAGESDEFSHLEADEDSKSHTKKSGSFKELVRSMKQIKDVQEIKEDPTELEELDLREDFGSSENINEKLDLTEQEMDVVQTRPDTTDIAELNVSDKENVINEVPEVNEFNTSEDQLSPSVDELKMEEKPKTDIIEKIPDEKITLTDAEEILVSESPTTSEETKEDVFEHLFQASSSKMEDNQAEMSMDRPIRSKSAEPEKRRKLSLESSYSRKSLSKLGILKKLRDASDIIRSTLTRSSSKKGSKPKIVGEIKKETKQTKVLTPQKFPNPVYIHIPLKPPEGEEDEFSHLENGEKQSKNPEPLEVETPSTPDSTLQGNDVQLIILTAPSDDEILDYQSSDVPETPSSDSGFFYKVDELKQLAKGAVDVVAGAKLEPVKEENGSDKISIEEKTDEKTEENIATVSDKVVDVEDGLSESKSPIPVESLTTQEVQQHVAVTDEERDTEDKEIKSVLKVGGSPLIKKKVSFKRRSRTSKDEGYEDIQPPEEVDKEKPQVIEVTEAVVDEEKHSLVEDAVTSASTEEDKNWSEMGDHEYEPINPPPDNVAVTATTMPVYTFNNDSDNEFLPLGDVPMDATPKMRSANATILEQSHEETGRVSPNVTFAPTPEKASTPEPDKPKSASSRFHMAFKQKTDDFKMKLHNIKRPNIHLPDKPKFNKPNFQKFKIEKSKFHMPKIPDSAKINFPSFSLPRRHTAKRPLKERQLSTESNAGEATDSKKPIFDFSTYPRLFKRKNKPAEAKSTDTIPTFATMPRSKNTNSSTAQDSSRWSGSDSVRIPLHSEDSMEAEYIEDNKESSPKLEADEESIENSTPSHIRYEQDIDIDDEYDRENNELNRDFQSRWDKGTFRTELTDNRFRNREKVTDLDSPEEPPNGYNFNSNHRDSKETRDNYSSGSSHGAQMPSGVLEEINSDEFLWRQKGISEENMDIRMYLSSEIKEAFRTPTNALTRLDDGSDVHGRHYNLRGSNQSLPEVPQKKKSIKKPKRKKTPHPSQEQIPYTGESADDDLDVEPPSRPRRRSKRTRKPKQFEEVIPYQETISVDVGNPEETFRHRESLGGILGDDEEEDSIMYENEQMEGREHPDLFVTDPYKKMAFVDEDTVSEMPAAPPRKHKSLKSLAMSENDSILDDVASTLESEIIKMDSKVIIPIRDEPPKRPSRTSSGRSSHSRGASQQDISNLTRISEPQLPCVEEPCVQDIRDCMGYAVIDKNKVRDPPLPPPRSLRRKRSMKMSEDKFFTVPRRQVDEVPTRPLRNYSTLSQVKKSNDNTYENKENIDTTGYVEIDDEPNKDLQSGEVIQKMKDRPLPAPPRPPRKSRMDAHLLQDITSRENIMSEEDFDAELVKRLEEIDTATQTEPLPDDFVCEEMVQEPTDTVIMASRNIGDSPVRERHIITPTVYRYEEETVTHGSVLVEPLNGARIIPDSELIHDSKENIIPVTRESDFDGTSSIPEDFHKLKPHTYNEPVRREAPTVTEMEVMKTQKLQVTDLDVDTLTVHKLLADKITVSEIDSSSVSTNEINSKSGSLKIGEISLPPELIEEIIRTIQLSTPIHAHDVRRVEEDTTAEQKKTSMNEQTVRSEQQQLPQHENAYSENESILPEHINVIPVPETLDIEVENIELSDPPPPFTYITQFEDEAEEFHQTNRSHSESPAKTTEPEISEDIIEGIPPARPPRNSEKPKGATPISHDELPSRSTYPHHNMFEPEVDDEPPPRPPQPHLRYVPSQPPASFYALRAQKYVESLGENLPAVPRRRRRNRSRHRTRSSSEGSSGATPSSRRFQRRLSEPSIPQLTAQLARICGTGVNNSIRRLITYVMKNVLGNEDGKQDLNVMIIIVLVLLTGLILLGYGDEKTVVHLHHWEYFNPPRDS